MEDIKIVYRGQITIFLSLILMLIISLIMGVVDSARIYSGRAQMSRAGTLAMEAFLTDYNIPLKERYGLFAVDGGYGDASVNHSYIEDFLNTYLRLNTDIFKESDFNWLEVSAGKISINSMKMLPLENYRYVEEGISDYIKYFKGIDTITSFVDKTNDKLREIDSDKDTFVSNLNRENELSKEMESGYEENNDVNIEEPADDPRKSMSKLMKTGILNLVVDSNTTISKAALNTSEVPFIISEEKETIQSTRFEKADDVLTDLKGEDFLSKLFTLGSLGFKSLAVNEYILDKFKNGPYSHEIKDKTFFQYEVEYIICGHKEDSRNLKSIVNRIIWMRSVMNTGYLMSDSEKSSAANTLAFSLATAIFMPFMAKVFYLLIIYAWAYAEAIIDCRALLNGKRVPLFKNSGNWKLTLTQLGSISADKMSGYSDNVSDTGDDDGIRYEDYLRIFLMMTSREKKLGRLLNLIHYNIRTMEDYSNFNIANCIYEIRCSAGYSVKTFFSLFRDEEYNYIYNGSMSY